MPIHPAISSKLHLLEGIRSFEEGMADPVTRARMDEFMSISDAPAPPDVAGARRRGTRTARARPGPGLHARPTATRSPVPGVAARRRVPVATSTCPRPTGPRGRCAPAPGAVVVSVDYRLAVGGVTTRFPTTTPSPPFAGSATPRPTSASTRPASPSAAPAPVATSRPAPPCSCAMWTAGCPIAFCSPTPRSTLSSRRSSTALARANVRSASAAALPARGPPRDHHELPRRTAKRCRRVRVARERRARRTMPGAVDQRRVRRPPRLERGVRRAARGRRRRRPPGAGPAACCTDFSTCHRPSNPCPTPWT